MTDDMSKHECWWVGRQCDVERDPCRCRSGQPIAVAILVATWNLLFEIDDAILLHRGAAVTATALDAAGHSSLARRFGQWIHGHDPGCVIDLFAAELGVPACQRSARPSTPNASRTCSPT